MVNYQGRGITSIVWLAGVYIEPVPAWVSGLMEITDP